MTRTSERDDGSDADSERRFGGLLPGRTDDASIDSVEAVRSVRRSV